MPEPADHPDQAQAYRFASWAVLLALFGLGTALNSFIVISANGVGPDFWWHNFPMILGRATSLTLAAALVIIPWRIVQHIRGTVTDAPVLMGAILFTALAAASVRVEMFESSMRALGVAG